MIKIDSTSSPSNIKKHSKIWNISNPSKPYINKHFQPDKFKSIFIKLIPNKEDSYNLVEILGDLKEKYPDFYPNFYLSPNNSHYCNCCGYDYDDNSVYAEVIAKKEKTKEEIEKEIAEHNEKNNKELEKYKNKKKEIADLIISKLNSLDRDAERFLNDRHIIFKNKDKVYDLKFIKTQFAKYFSETTKSKMSRSSSALANYMIEFIMPHLTAFEKNEQV